MRHLVSLGITPERPPETWNFLFRCWIADYLFSPRVVSLAIHCHNSLSTGRALLFLACLSETTCLPFPSAVATYPRRIERFPVLRHHRVNRLGCVLGDGRLHSLYGCGPSFLKACPPLLYYSRFLFQGKPPTPTDSDRQLLSQANGGTCAA